MPTAASESDIGPRSARGFIVIAVLWILGSTGRPVGGAAPPLRSLLDRYPVALLVRPA